MKENNFVIEDGERPVVFSASPDSPAAPYVIEHRPSSLEDMYELGIMPGSIKIEHLEEARDIVSRVRLPDAVFADEQGRWFADRAIPGLITVPREYAIIQETILRTTRHLEIRGYDSAEAKLTAQKAAYFIASEAVEVPVWRAVNLLEMDLDVHGILYVERSIHEISARNVTFRKHGWIVPAGNNFLLTCQEIRGTADDPLEVLDVEGIVQEAAGLPHPGPPIEGWDDRLAIHDIQRLAGEVTQGWR